MYSMYSMYVSISISDLPYISDRIGFFWRFESGLHWTALD